MIYALPTITVDSAFINNKSFPSGQITREGEFKLFSENVLAP